MLAGSEMELEPARAPAPSFAHQPHAPAFLKQAPPSLPSTDNETDEDVDVENREDRPLLSVTSGPGKGEGGVPWGNFNYPPTGTHGSKPSLTCENLPPTYAASPALWMSVQLSSTALLKHWRLRSHADRCGSCLESFERAEYGCSRGRGFRTGARCHRRWTVRSGHAGYGCCAAVLICAALRACIGPIRQNMDVLPLFIRSCAVGSSLGAANCCDGDTTAYCHWRCFCVQPMLLLTYALVIGISCSLFSMTVRRVYAINARAVADRLCADTTAACGKTDMGSSWMAAAGRHLAASMFSGLAVACCVP